MMGRKTTCFPTPTAQIAGSFEAVVVPKSVFYFFIFLAGGAYVGVNDVGLVELSASCCGREDKRSSGRGCALKHRSK